MGAVATGPIPGSENTGGAAGARCWGYDGAIFCMVFWICFGVRDWWGGWAFRKTWVVANLHFSGSGFLAFLFLISSQQSAALVFWIFFFLIRSCSLALVSSSSFFFCIAKLWPV